MNRRSHFLHRKSTNGECTDRWSTRTDDSRILHLFVYVRRCFQVRHFRKEIEEIKHTHTILHRGEEHEYKQPMINLPANERRVQQTKTRRSKNTGNVDCLIDIFFLFSLRIWYQNCEINTDAERKKKQQMSNVYMERRNVATSFDDGWIRTSRQPPRRQHSEHTHEQWRETLEWLKPEKRRRRRLEISFSL